MDAVELIKVLKAKEIMQEPLDGKQITSCVNDTRQIISGSCYIAIRGERFDGHQALEEAVQAGATVLVVEEVPQEVRQLAATIVKVPSTNRAQAILANQFYQQPTQKLNVIATTGTNGKSTVTTMINDLLMTHQRVTGMIGTIQYKVADKVEEPLNTTPNAVELQRYFAEMVAASCTDALIEASSHALTLGRLWYTDVDVAIYTNLSREHLDFHQTMENYAQAKSLLFSQLGQAFSDQGPKLAIINQDDQYASLMASVTSAEVLTYSLQDSNATAYATEIENQQGQLHFTINYQNEAFPVTLPMVGRYNVANYLAAFLTLVAYHQWSPQEVITATNQFEGVSGRMQTIDCGQPFDVIVDFAHTPDAIRGVLSELKTLVAPDGALRVLLGHSGGNRDSGARPEIGDIVFEYADEIVFTADNPRFEPVDKITREIIGDHPQTNWVLIEDRQEAIDFTLQQANPDDIVVFLGKGGEPYQVIGDDYVPYHEADYVRSSLQQLLMKED